jgi:hypothetical protein
MRMLIGEHSHGLKLKIYNTICTLDAQGLGKEVHTVFDHLGNKTVGEYFANVIIPEVAEYMNNNLNIKDLKERYLKLAREDLKMAKTNKSICVACKTNSLGNMLKCKYCKRSTHEDCARKFLTADSLKKKISKPGSYQCTECVIKIL